MAAEIEKRQRGTIMEKLTDAATKLGGDVGQYQHVKFKIPTKNAAQKPVHVNFLLLVLSDRVDPGRSIRRGLKQRNLRDVREKQDVFCWAENSELMEAEGDVSDMQKLEYRILRQWLKKTFPKPEIQARPLDSFLFDPDMTPTTSVTCRLRKRYVTIHEESNENNSDGNCTVVFIGPLDRNIVHYRQYMRHCLPTLFEEHVTFKRKLVCVFDVNSHHHMGEMSQILPTGYDHFKTQIYSAFDPSRHSVSCVALTVVLKGEIF